MCYNGWTNYETWLCNLWMNESWEYYYELAKEACRNSIDDNTIDRDEAIKSFAKMLQDELYVRMHEVGTYGLLRDLLLAGIYSIDFHEIASRWIDDVAGEVADELADELAEEDSESC